MQNTFLYDIFNDHAGRCVFNFSAMHGKMISIFYNVNMGGASIRMILRYIYLVFQTVRQNNIL